MAVYLLLLLRGRTQPPSRRPPLTSAVAHSLLLPRPTCLFLNPSITSLHISQSVAYLFDRSKPPQSMEGRSSQGMSHRSRSKLPVLLGVRGRCHVILQPFLLLEGLTAQPHATFNSSWGIRLALPVNASRPQLTYFFR